MARKKSFLPKGDPELAIWLRNLSAKINKYASKYLLTDEEIDKLQKGAAFLIYWITTVEQVRAKMQGLTAYKNEVRDGLPAGGGASVMPQSIDFSPPPAVSPGVTPYILSIVGRIKSNQTYTVADGKDMGLEGAEQFLDRLNLKPIFKIELEGGRPNLIWTKGLTDGVKIKVARFAPGELPELSSAPDAKTFKLLAMDTQPDYIDTFPLPPFGQSAVWMYVMIYVIDDEEIGQWSDPVMVTVTGTP